MKYTIASILTSVALAINALAFDLSVEVLPPVGATNLPTTVTLGETIKYRLAVVNQGTNTVTGAVLIDWVDPSSRILSVASGRDQSIIQNQIAIAVPLLEPGVVFFTTITVRPTLGGRVTDYILVSSGVPDDSPENNVAMAQTAVTGGIMLLIDQQDPAAIRLQATRIASGCVLERSMDLEAWTPVLTNLGLPAFSITITNDLSTPAAFYRVVERQ